MACCRQAAAKAMARSAYREAVVSIEQALGTLAHLPERRAQPEQAFDLRLELRNAIWPLGQFRKIREILHEAEACAARLDDPRRLGRVAVYLCVSFYGAAQHNAAVAAGERALALSVAPGASQLQVLAHSYLGQALVARTDYARGIESLWKVVAFLAGERRLERLGQGALPAVLARVNLVRGLVELGRFTESVACGSAKVDTGVQDPVARCAPALFVATRKAYVCQPTRRGRATRRRGPPLRPGWPVAAATPAIRGSTARPASPPAGLPARCPCLCHR